MSILIKNSFPTVAERLTLLKKLKSVIKQHESAICEALYQDLRKPKFESMATETQFVLSELSFIISNLKEWTKPEKVSGTLLNFPSKEYIYKQPYGRVLIFSPWNYPFQLAISPLIGAIAAGNSVVLKPSEFSSHTSAITKEILQKVFDIQFVTVIEGGPELAQQLLKQQWDYIFYSGSTKIGREVYQAAAKNLTPVTLELGGKSPCIVDETASIELAAKRIAWGKFVNAGQTCIAPDFIVVHESRKTALVDALKKAITKMYGENIQQSDDFARIIHKRHFERLTTLLQNKTLIFGGQTDSETLYLAPTIVDAPNLDSALMQEEIFGPILPIIIYKFDKDLDVILKRYENPLALYVFSNDKKFTEAILTNYSFGGSCVNDTLMHLTNKELPFGGVGNSGIGSYHGKHSFNTFTHRKSIVKRGKLDIPLRYAPYQKVTKFANWLSKFI
ncbi:aldehyde dehydrogenase [Pustulibacterium marinum]|uniref:aldehyde dehydrogenase n=1 Tax=Pustulibacterium marinum TaxID=1224947 RepID=UPI001FE9A5DE|nr:aldehyde dehydrogenase [Pustulibacterium marinum]